MRINIILDLQAIDGILAVLDRQPHGEVRGLIDAIASQRNEQIRKAQQSAIDERVKEAMDAQAKTAADLSARIAETTASAE